MHKKIYILLTIAHCVMLNGMEKKIHKDAYDCEELMQEFTHLQGTKKDMDNTMLTLLKRSNSSTKHLHNQVAALICFGANPDMINLGYVIETDDVPMTSFLVKRRTHINSNNNFHFKVRSVAMAQELAPYLNIEKINHDYNHKNTIVHNLAKESNPDLLEYYLEKSDLANVRNGYGELPLHVLGNNCHGYTKDIMRKQATSLIKKTKNINERDNKGYTPLDAAMTLENKRLNGYELFVATPSCKELTTMLKEHGAKSTLYDVQS